MKETFQRRGAGLLRRSIYLGELRKTSERSQRGLSGSVESFVEVLRVIKVRYSDEMIAHFSTELSLIRKTFEQLQGIDRKWPSPKAYHQ